MTKKPSGRSIRLISAVTVGLLAITGLAASAASAGAADPVIYRIEALAPSDLAGVVEVKVLCKVGTVPIGYWGSGGVGDLPHLERVTYVPSAQSPGSPGLAFRARSSGSWAFQASVLCIAPPAGYEHVAGNWVSKTGRPATAYATCPAGKSLIGSTFAMMVGTGAWPNLQTLVSDTTGQFTKVVGAASNNVGVAVMAGAFCADRPLSGLEHVTATIPASQGVGTAACSSTNKAAYAVGIQTTGYASNFRSDIQPSYLYGQLSYGAVAYWQTDRPTVVHALCMDYSSITASWAEPIMR